MLIETIQKKSGGKVKQRCKAKELWEKKRVAAKTGGRRKARKRAKELRFRKADFVERKKGESKGVEERKGKV